MQTLAFLALSCGFFGQTDVGNLDLSQASLKGWEGAGFYLTAGARGPGSGFGLCSSDAGSPTRQGTIRCVLRIPAGVSKLVFRAYVATPVTAGSENRLDIVLAGDDETPLPLFVRTSAGWTPTPRLLPRWEGKARDYAWEIADHQGRLMQVVLLDKDDRPGFHLFAAGFRFVKGDQFLEEDFTRHMVDLTAKHKLEPVARYDSKRFLALSNASEPFSMQTMRFCETFYDLFFHHFQKRGFVVRQPAQTMMLAVFGTPEGFDAYMGRKMPAGLMGMYHQGTNRLIIYDLRKNRGLLAARDKALKKGVPAKDKPRFVDSVHQEFDELAKDFNVSTTMHEAAHQLSFNCGLLNRHGDVAAWLAEGLACYCEATDSGDWTAIGSFNMPRARDLRHAASGKNPWIPLKTLVDSDSWLDGPLVLQGYAQSWALFHMLMREHTPRLRSYLKTVYPRRTPEQRLADFSAAFGDLAALETRYIATMRKFVDELPTR